MKVKLKDTTGFVPEKITIKLESKEEIAYYFTLFATASGHDSIKMYKAFEKLARKYDLF